MPFKIFRTAFPTVVALHVIKNNSGLLNTYNQSGIKQLDMCTVRLRHKDKIAKDRFFVFPDDGPVLLGMPAIKLLDILKICVKLWETNK